MFNPFTWLRRQAAEAVVLGTADGLRAVSPDGIEPPTDLAELRQLLAANAGTKQLVAAPPDDDEPAPASKRKAAK